MAIGKRKEEKKGSGIFIKFDQIQQKHLFKKLKTKKKI